MKLTKAESQVVRALLRGGPTNRTIASELGLKLNTVKSHLSKACTKVGTSSRVGLALAIVRNPKRWLS